MIGLTMFLFEGIWTLGLWIRKAVECFKCCLMGHTSRNMEDSVAEGDLNYGALDQEVSEKRMWLFGPCPKSLPEDKVKRFGLIMFGRGNLKTI